MIFCICFIVSSIGIGFILSGKSELADTIKKQIPEDIKKQLPENLFKMRDEDAALKREYGELNDNLAKSQSEASQARQDETKKSSDASKARAARDDAGRKLQAAAARSRKAAAALEAANTAEEVRLAEEARKKAEEETAAAAKELARKAEEARLAEEARQRAVLEKRKKEQEAIKAKQETQRKAKALATLKDGCKNTTWENVYVGGRPGMDLAFWDKTSIITGGTTITKGNKKITTDRSTLKTSVQENQRSGTDRRGRATYSWRSKASYDGFIAINGDKVGYVGTVKAPDRWQPTSCKKLGKNCNYRNGDFNELHNFNDGGKELKFVIVNNHMGVMQAKTGKFYSIPDKKVMDNPLTSDCKTKLDYK